MAKYLFKGKPCEAQSKDEVLRKFNLYPSKKNLAMVAKVKALKK